MIFTPVNNYLYVKVVEKKTPQENDILLPEDYRSVESPFVVVEVIHCSGESGTLWGEGLRIMVEAQMLQNILYEGETITVIKENYVIGILSE